MNPTRIVVLLGLGSAGCGSELPTAPSAPSYSYCVTRVTGNELCFSGNQAYWYVIPIATASSHDTSYVFFLDLTVPTQPGDDTLPYPGLFLSARADRFGPCPTSSNYRLRSTMGDTVSVEIGTASGSYFADSGLVTTRKLQNYYFDGSLDLWFHSPQGPLLRPDFHLVGTFAAQNTSGLHCPA
jgi:hypothetical protein